MDLDAPLSWLNNIMVYQGLWITYRFGGRLFRDLVSLLVDSSPPEVFEPYKMKRGHFLMLIN